MLKIQGLIKKFDGAPGIFIYLERVKNIAREKYKEMRCHDQSVNKALFFISYLLNKKKSPDKYSAYYFNPNSQSRTSSSSHQINPYEDVQTLQKQVEMKKKQLNEISNLVDQFRSSRGASQSERLISSSLYTYKINKKID